MPVLMLLESLIPFLTGQPAHGKKGCPLPPHEYGAVGLTKDFEKIAAAVFVQQIESG